ncbi:MAG: hypothetical protein ACREJM_12155, partial [Candidatus Saccharimonadales bacterium]
MIKIVPRFGGSNAQSEAPDRAVAQNTAGEQGSPRTSRTPDSQTAKPGGPPPSTNSYETPSTAAAEDPPNRSPVDSPAASDQAAGAPTAQGAKPDKPADEAAAADTDDGKMPPAAPAANSEAKPDSPGPREATSTEKREPTSDAPAPSDGADAAPGGDDPPSDSPDDAKTPAPPTITAEPPLDSVPMLMADPRAYDTMFVWNWDVAPKQPKLLLRGLDFANRHLAGSGKIVATDAKGGLEVALAQRDDAEPIRLAALHATDQGLSFQWTKPAGKVKSLRECQDFLRRCVVKVESEGPPLYIALSRPSKLEPLPLSNASALLDRHALS